MSSGLLIRPAAAEDLDAIAHLESVCFPSPWRREFFAGELAAAGRFSLVALHEERMAGYLFAMWIFEEMHVNKIAVRHDLRRRGVASALMDQCLFFARAHAITLISLEVRRSNRAAQDFYARLDFRPSYIRPRYYPDGEAALVMTRALTPPESP